MKVKIYYVEVAPELESKEFDLAAVIKSKGECIVGRSPECDLPLEGSDLSRQHGKFLIKNDYYYFADLGSSNGSLFNGELANPNQEYLLNIGDTIRLGDFVLKMEPAEEIAATVMKVLDPALFKPRPPLIVDASQPEPQISPVVPAIGLAAAAISMPIIVDRSESEEERLDLSIENPLPPVLIEDEVNHASTPDLVVTEPPLVGLVEDEWSNDNSSDYLQESTFEQVVPDQPVAALVIEDECEVIETPTPVIPQYSIFEQVATDRPLAALAIEDEDEIEQPDLVIPAQPLSVLVLDDEDDQVAALPDSVITSEQSSPLVLEDQDEEDEFADPVIATQPSPSLVLDHEEEELADPVIAEQPSSTLAIDEKNEELPDPVIAAEPQSTVVLDELSNPVIAEQPSASLVIDEEDEDEDEDEDLTDSVIATQQPASSLAIDEEDEDEDEEFPDPVIVTEPPSTLVLDDKDEVTEDLIDSSTLMETAPTLVVDEGEEPELITSIVTEQPAAILVDEDDDDRVAVPDPAAGSPATTLAIEDEDPEELPDLFATVQPPAGLVEEDDDENLPNLLVAEQLSDDVVVGEVETAESLTQDENLQVEPISTLPVATAATAVAVAINPPHKKFGAELLSQKQIVLIAHDEKVADLTDLVNQHKDFLSTCLTISWASIAGTLRQETGMSVSKELPSGVSGGFQTLAGLVNSGDVLAVIFLKDFFAQAQTGQANEEALLRLCNINEILLATNIATAESIVHYLQS
jgi:methylglyoxal synthase